MQINLATHVIQTNQFNQRINSEKRFYKVTYWIFSLLISLF